MFALFWPQDATVVGVTPVILFQPPLGHEPNTRKLRIAAIIVSTLITLNWMTDFYSTVSGDHFDDKTKLFVTAYTALTAFGTVLGVLSTVCVVCNKETLLWLSVLSSSAIVVILVVGVWLLEWSSAGPGTEILRTVLFALYARNVCDLFCQLISFGDKLLCPCFSSYQAETCPKTWTHQLVIIAVSPNEI